MEFSQKTIIVFSNITGGLVRFRLEVLAALAREHRVVVIAEDTGDAQKLIAAGCEFIDLPLNRHGINPIEDLRLMKAYEQFLDQYRPMAALTHTIKPNVYGGMACAKHKVPYVSNITGLGDAIENAGPISTIARQLYKRGVKHSYKVFFQNQSNCDFFLKNALYQGRYEVLPGSGVNLQENPYEPYPELEQPIVLSVIGRITRDKGISEILDAAHRLSGRGVKLQLIGDCEGDYLDRIHTAENAGELVYVGRQSNVHEWLAGSHAILHASYHEGMSNVLLEAAACGRPILATNVPGCKEAYDEGVSGFGFAPHDTNALVAAVDRFLALSHQAKSQMGKAGRAKMEACFDRTIVIDRYLAAVKEIEGVQ